VQHPAQPTPPAACPTNPWRSTGRLRPPP